MLLADRRTQLTDEIHKIVNAGQGDEDHKDGIDPREGDIQNLRLLSGHPDGGFQAGDPHRGAEREDKEIRNDTEDLLSQCVQLVVNKRENNMVVGSSGIGCAKHRARQI